MIQRKESVINPSYSTGPLILSEARAYVRSQKPVITLCLSRFDLATELKF
ncbi:MAG: hypothetical protein LBV77_03760 [Candidatus Adiutrix intracellularis]|nr:hypothetical protein [Candidatus Adiutrix intracellularis]